MQKKVMALAVAGALALPTVAVAQSSVQISGRGVIEYGHADGGSNRPSTDMADNPGGANIRFTSQESLGGGLTAWFQCESSVDVRGTDQEGLCGRNSAVGFRGGFGNIYMGKWDTPFKRALNQGTVGAEETGILGMSWMAFGGSGSSDVSNENESTLRQRWKRRETSMLTYDSPNFSGFQVMAAVTDARGATSAVNGNSNQKPRLWSIGGTYINGPLAIGAGYEKHDDIGARNLGTDVSDDAWGVGASYTFGQVTLGAFYLDATYEMAAGQETKKKTWGAGVDWRLTGPHMLSIQYVKANDTKGNGGNVGTGNGALTGCRQGVVVNCSETGGQEISLGYTYRFSKRTTIRLGYVRMENDDRTNSYRIGSTGSVANGDTVDGYAVLVKHDF